MIILQIHIDNSAHVIDGKGQAPVPRDGKRPNTPAIAGQMMRPEVGWLLKPILGRRNEKLQHFAEPRTTSLGRPLLTPVRK